MPSERDPFQIDYDELKERIREAVRAAFQEHAEELGISYDAAVAQFFGEEEGAAP
jgi:hypothetical protein